MNRLVFMIAFVISAKASAGTVTFEYVNLDHREIDGVSICIDSLFFCSPIYVSECGPMETCAVSVPMPDGCYRVYAVSTLGGMRSNPSNSIINPSFNAKICHDSDGDGDIGWRDWQSVVAEWQK